MEAPRPPNEATSCSYNPAPSWASTRSRVSVTTYMDDPMYPAIVRAWRRSSRPARCRAGGGSRRMAPEAVRRRELASRAGPIPERVVKCNLTRLSRLLRILRFHATTCTSSLRDSVHAPRQGAQASACASRGPVTPPRASLLHPPGVAGQRRSTRRRRSARRRRDRPEGSSATRSLSRPRAAAWVMDCVRHQRDQSHGLSRRRRRCLPSALKEAPVRPCRQPLRRQTASAGS